METSYFTYINSVSNDATYFKYHEYQFISIAYYNWSKNIVIWQYIRKDNTIFFLNFSVLQREHISVSVFRQFLHLNLISHNRRIVLILILFKFRWQQTIQNLTKKYAEVLNTNFHFLQESRKAAWGENSNLSFLSKKNSLYQWIAISIPKYAEL